MASLFTTQTPTGTNFADGTPSITTATSVVFAVAGSVTAVRFFATTTVSGTYTVAIWQVTSNDSTGHTGTLLASKTMGAPPAAGAWNSITLDSPVPVNTGTLYRVGVYSSAGRYVATPSFFTTGLTNGSITAPPNGSDPVALGTLGQGTFVLNATLAYPENTSGNSASYFVDVDFTATGGSTNGTAAVALPAATVAASGAVVSAGTANPALPALSASASGTAAAGATVAAVTPAVAAAVSGTARTAASVTPALPPMLMQAAGTASVAGGTSATLPPMQVGVSATAAVTGTAACALASLVAAFQGSAATTASAVVVLPAVTASGSDIPDLPRRIGTLTATSRRAALTARAVRPSLTAGG